MMRQLKSKILLFAVFFLSGYVFCSGILSKAAGGENAFIACLIDDDNFMYKTQVIYSSEEIERDHVGLFVGQNPSFYDVSGKAGGSFSQTDLSKLITVYNASFTTPAIVVGGKPYNNLHLDMDAETGIYSLTATTDKGDKVDGTAIDSWDVDYDQIDSFKTFNFRPLTFPGSNTRNAKESDINRAYEVADRLGEDFRSALLFVNDGKSFTSVEALVDTAYALVTASDNGGSLINQFGTTYKITYNKAASYGRGYEAYCTITRPKGAVTDNAERTKSFVYAIRKGYRKCKDGDLFESGVKNNLNKNEVYGADPVYITWQHLFIEAGIMYAEGISYANQADLYKISDFEDSIVKLFRSILGGLKNVLQLYAVEDCIFNNSVRGSKAFVYGIYYDNFSHSIFLIFMIMMSISFSLIVLSLIRIIMKKEFSAANPMERYSIMNGIKDLVMTMFMLSLLWLAIRFLFLINYRFVDIFDQFADGKKIVENAGGYSSVASIIYQFTLFGLQIYINIIYIMRGLMIPLLIMVSPLCVYTYSLGDGGKKVTSAWLKELLGNIFIQSIHALCIGFMLTNHGGLRGIESVAMLSSVIPVTGVVKEIFGLGGSSIIKSAGNLAGGATAMTGAAIGGAAGVAGGVMSGVGKSLTNTNTVVGSVLGGAARGVGGFSNTVGGIGNAGMGFGVAATGGNPMTNFSQGMSQTEKGLSSMGSVLGDGAVGLTKSAVGLTKSYAKGKADYLLHKHPELAQGTGGPSGASSATAGTSPDGPMPQVNTRTAGANGHGFNKRPGGQTKGNVKPVKGGTYSAYVKDVGKNGMTNTFANTPLGQSNPISQFAKKNYRDHQTYNFRKFDVTNNEHAKQVVNRLNQIGDDKKAYRDYCKELGVKRLSYDKDKQTLTVNTGDVKKL